jgi:hypothetical protein
MLFFQFAFHFNTYNTNLNYLNSGHQLLVALF